MEMQERVAGVIAALKAEYPDALCALQYKKDYELDGSVLFHLLYTFERENHIFQKEKFEEHYHPFSRALWEQTLSSLGYQNLQILPFPAQRPYAPGSELDWYTVLAQKPES